MRRLYAFVTHNVTVDVIWRNILIDTDDNEDADDDKK